jgi:Protein of unknown function (DUF3622)
MTSNKKYTTRTVQTKTDWTAEIVRRVTSKKTTVSKSQGGFSSEEEAQSWAEKELAAFLENLTKRNKADFAEHLTNKKAKEERAELYRQRKIDNEKTALADAEGTEGIDPE